MLVPPKSDISCVPFDAEFFKEYKRTCNKCFCRRNMEAINKALSRCGFFLIGETDFKKTTAQILEIYRRRDVVEKSFDNLKNDIDMRRLYVQSDEVAEVKCLQHLLH